MSVLNNYEQMIKIADSCPSLKGKVYSIYPKARTKTPFAIIYRVGKIPDYVDVPECREALATFTYSLDIYAQDNTSLQEIGDFVTNLYMPYNILITGDAPIRSPNKDVVGKSLTLRFQLDEYGCVTQ